MKDSKTYLVGRTGSDPYDFLLISIQYEDDDKPVIVVQMGLGPLAQGPMLHPAKMLEFRPHIFHDEIIDGRLKMVGMEQEPPGWFGRKCKEAGCEWFVPYVERMSKGEEVALEELKEAYRMHNHGREMPESVIGRPFPNEENRKQG
jgi:hypothetical protein